MSQQKKRRKVEPESSFASAITRAYSNAAKAGYLGSKAKVSVEAEEERKRKKRRVGY